jgi:hypothetical protein
MSEWRDFHAVGGYRVPELRGLTVAEATDQWTYRYGGSVTQDDLTWTTVHVRTHTLSVTPEGFTGGVTPGDAPADAIVTSWTTTPSYAAGVIAAAGTAVRLFYTAYLATPSGDRLTTATGNYLTT